MVVLEVTLVDLVQKMVKQVDLVVLAVLMSLLMEHAVQIQVLEL